MMKKIIGLSKSEVNLKIKEGKVNIAPKPVVKSNLQIIISHVFNYLMHIILLLLLL